jgi:hypothetical protein
MFKLLPLVIRDLRYYYYDGVWKNTPQEGGKKIVKSLNMNGIVRQEN